MGRIRVGCCGFPRGRRDYFAQFEAVEVQQTFYKPPRMDTVRRWRQEAGEAFHFTLKAWQLITHPASSPTYRRAGIRMGPEEQGEYGFFRPTQGVVEAWMRTEELALALEAKVVVFQCPPSFRESAENVENLRHFFSRLGRQPFLLAWEPRGGWGEEAIRRLCAELGLIHCVDPFLGPPLTPGVRYFRLHGGPGYRHHYQDEELLALRQRCGEGEAYCLFNNLSMYEDALRFQRLLRDG